MQHVTVIMIKNFMYTLVLLPVGLLAQVKPAYTIFNAGGKMVAYQKMIRSIAKADVVFFGELHNNTLAHWIELQVLKDLHAQNTNLTLGMEMFEADDQIVLDEYLTGLIEEKHLLNEAKIWDNYKTDYKPLVEFARKNTLPVIATNVPRRYANLVYRKGLQSLDSLASESKQWIAPLPLTIDYTLSGYAAMMEGMGQHGNGPAENLVASQALKDATMAYFIASRQEEGNLFYHINGAYHTQDYQGIIHYLKKLRSSLEIITLQVVEQAVIDDLDDANRGKADFIFCITSDMTKSY